jgi:hypothetical protein
MQHPIPICKIFCISPRATPAKLLLNVVDSDSHCWQIKENIMLGQFLTKLAAESAATKSCENGEGITKIAEEYFTSIAGGILSEESPYGQYVQNYGDNGPHPGPYWQDISFAK